MALGKKTGGRRPGSTNKVTAKMKKRIAAFVDDNWDTIQHDFGSLESKDRIALFEKFLAYIVPKAADTKTVDVLSNGSDAGIQLIFSETPLSDKDVDEIRKIQNGESIFENNK